MLKKGTNIVLYVLIFTIPVISNAQCAMCRAVLESESDTSTAEGINNGIVFLMAIPYVLVALIGFVIYRKFKS